MRKGYGPTGVSYPYFKADFMADVEAARDSNSSLLVCIVTGDFMTWSDVSPDVSDDAMMELYGRLDHVSLKGGKHFVMYL